MRLAHPAWACFFDKPVPYPQAVRIQEATHAARLRDAVPDTVYLLEHEPVVTLGARGRTEHLKLAPEALQAKGIELVHASRGGDVTYHGPGQAVLYPILRLGDREADAHGYLHNLEEIALRTAADFGVNAWRREGKNGAWTEAGKIAAIGFRLRRWITMHGMSFNVDVDLSGFETIVPCGLVGEPVASLKTLMGSRCPPVREVKEALAGHFEAVCGRRLQRMDATDACPEALRACLEAPKPPPFRHGSAATGRQYRRTQKASPYRPPRRP